MRKTEAWFATMMALLAIGLLLAFCTCSEARAEDRKTSVKSMLSSATYSAGSAAYSSGFEVGQFNEGLILIDVTAEAETSTLDVVVQTSPDDATWFAHTTVSQITATGQYLQAISNFGKYVRI